ncbi:MAG TPA: hypothetical protein VFQ60_05210 [Patescibacteria group bacterium]|nr:hypothetical protein [Patescibacteria group bacterium]
MFDSFFTWWTTTINQFLDFAGNNPFGAMWFLFLHGGWIVFAWMLLYMFKWGWLYNVQSKAAAKKEWVLLRITVPRAHEQTPKATENMFAYLAGAHSSISWTDTWLRGTVQSPIALEIVSLEGLVNYYVRAERKMRDLVEAAIYAQYPDAEIHEATDYAVNVPSFYPDEEWDMWGVEVINVNPDPYPLKTYHDFVDQVSGEFKDPLAAMLEVFSRFGPGEQAWYQIIITPTDQKETRARAEKVINELKGVKKEPKKTGVEKAIGGLFGLLREILGIFTGAAKPEVKKDARQDFPKLFALSPGEREILEAVERKAGKIGFQTKMRFIYVGKKTVFQKARAAAPFIGAIKQVNTFHMQAIKPDLKVTGMSSSIWFFKDRRNNLRKRKLIANYRARSNWAGRSGYNMSSEELATLWHFPILTQVKAPQLQRTEAKKAEAPSNVPFA